MQPYIDELQEEITKILREVGPGKTDEEMQAGIRRLQVLVGKLSKRLTAELGLSGDYMLLLMLTSGMLALAWTAFYLKRITLDNKKPFEQRLVMIELHNELGEAVSGLLSSATTYAEMYEEKPGTKTA